MQHSIAKKLNPLPDHATVKHICKSSTLMELFIPQLACNRETMLNFSIISTSYYKNMIINLKNIRMMAIRLVANENWRIPLLITRHSISILIHRDVQRTNPLNCTLLIGILISFSKDLPIFSNITIFCSTSCMWMYSWSTCMLYSLLTLHLYAELTWDFRPNSGVVRWKLTSISFCPLLCWGPSSHCWWRFRRISTIELWYKHGRKYKGGIKVWARAII